jgi:hypothetical protein
MWAISQVGTALGGLLDVPLLDVRHWTIVRNQQVAHRHCPISARHTRTGVSQ